MTLLLPRPLGRTLRRIALAAALTLPATPAFAEEAADISGAQRIVSIGGSVTEIMYALGEEGRLVARDSTSGFPDAATALPDVGYMRALSPEGVLSVKPDAILMLDGSGPPEALAVLREAGVPYVAVPETYDRAGILGKIDKVGEAIGASDKAARLSEQVAAELDAAIDEAKARGRAARVLFILSMNGGRILASGTGTAANGIIEMAGATNAMDVFEGYKQINDRGADRRSSRRDPDDQPRRRPHRLRRPSVRQCRAGADAGRPEQAADPDGRPLPDRLRPAHRRCRARPVGGAGRHGPLREARP